MVLCVYRAGQPRRRSGRAPVLCNVCAATERSEAPTGEQHWAALEERRSRALGRKQKAQPGHQENNPVPGSAAGRGDQGGSPARDQYRKMWSSKDLLSRGVRGTYSIRPMSMTSPHPSPGDPLPVSSSGEVTV